MRKIVPIVSLALLGTALASCGSPDTATDADATDAVVAEETAATEEVTELMIGEMAITYPDGTAVSLTIQEDGAYSRVVGDGLPTAGVAKVVDGKVCFDPSGPDEAVCWSKGPTADDGSFTATNDEGVAVSVQMPSA